VSSVPSLRLRGRKIKKKELGEQMVFQLIMEDAEGKVDSRSSMHQRMTV